MKALILAAGYATRLYPLTLDRAKPLLPVGKKTMIDHVSDKIEAIEAVDTIYVVTNEKFSGQFRDWASARKGRVPARVINDKTLSNDDRLGAIGDIALSIKEGNIYDDLLVVAGDNLFDMDLRDFVAFAESKGGAPTIAVYDIKDRAKAGLYGVLEVDNDGKVTRFEEKPKEPKSTLVSTCIYFFPKATLAYVQEYLSKSRKKDAPGNYIRWLAENRGIYGFAFDEAWYDIGSKASLEEVQHIYACPPAGGEGNDGR